MNKQKDFFDKLSEFLRDIDLLKNYIPPIHRAGYPFIILFIIFTIILSILSDFLGWVGIFLTIWCIYFFRDPERVITKKDNVVVAPADGRILSISTEFAPKNLSEDKEKKMKKISIFMNIFNVHVNRIPISGRVIWLKYIPGAFLNASLDKASEKNERMISKIEINKDVFVYVVQIAGLVARRIKCELEENQTVNIGDRFGIIRFGSRVDLYIPESFKINSLENQISVAGETILAEFDAKNVKK